MRKSLFSLLTILLFPFLFLAQESQYIEWTGEDEIANEMVANGIDHLMNIEFEKAVTMLDAAVKQDPTLFAPHVQLSLFSRGDKREYHKAEALRLVEGKNEVSKLYASLLTIERAPGAGKIWRSTWKKMNELAFDGRFVNFNYARSLQDDEMRIAALEDLLAKNQKTDRATGHIHNLLGYAYTTKGETDKAKMHFEKYIEVRPIGYNAYDSMAEFYLNEGKLEKSLELYKKAVEEFPMARNANEQIDEIEKMIANKDLGDLILIRSEYVQPEHIEEYVQWGKEYKAEADKDNFTDFFVSQGDGAFHYIVNVGKDLSGVDKYNEAWEEWNKGSDVLGDMYEKYKHTMYKAESSLWRHMPNQSYVSEMSGNTPNKYSRVYYAHIKIGQEKAAMDILTEFKTVWEGSGVTEGFMVYKNVFGDDENCVAIVSNFDTEKEWIDDRADVAAKVGKEKLDELFSKWSKLVRISETAERFPQADLSHFNPQEEN